MPRIDRTSVVGITSRELRQHSILNSGHVLTTKPRLALTGRWQQSLHGEIRCRRSHVRSASTVICLRQRLTRPKNRASVAIPAANNRGPRQTSRSHSAHRATGLTAFHFDSPCRPRPRLEEDPARLISRGRPIDGAEDQVRATGSVPAEFGRGSELQVQLCDPILKVPPPEVMDLACSVKK